jgi:cystathionine beta-lyase family protein involved in aluminum resistance
MTTNYSMMKYWLLLSLLTINYIHAYVPPTPTLVQDTARGLRDQFYDIDMRTMRTMDKILGLYKEFRIDASAFHGVNGYGHGDYGRECMDNIIAKLMGAEAALVRLQLFSGTHAIATCLFGSLRPGQNMLCVSGHPYDTLEEVIGQRVGHQTGNYKGSLKDWNIGYSELELLHGDEAKMINNDIIAFDFKSIEFAIENDPAIKLIHIQRSCGYSWRPSLPVKEIGRLCTHLKQKYADRDLVMFVDNCYGELVEEIEPTHVGADLIAGSLIKNLGGTLAPCGGYIAGRRDLVNQATVHLSAPGVDGGATFNQYRTLFQGLFMAPSIVGESIKGAMLVSEVLEKQLGYPCNPSPGSHRTDIIQAVRLGSRAKLIAFCEAVQRKSPVGAHIRSILTVDDYSMYFVNFELS